MKKLLNVVSIICYGFAGFFVYKGYDKMTNYFNSDSLTLSSHNAYVGGDAYNYIINAGQATAFFVVALTCVIIASTILILNKLNQNNH
jgi:hypothetical protein